ncbi:MAG TPA: O-antigen polymerase [Ignavibacteriaceae bacterium]|nr:O-antigen polymerase [Ignavibacteriaceae bacterium]
MLSVALISLTIFFLLLLTFLNRKIDVLSPSRLFLLLWSFAIGITNFKFSLLQKEWSSYGWLMLILTLLSFVAGFFIVYVLNVDKKIKTIPEIRQILSKQVINKDLLFKILVFSFILYIISFFVSYLVMGFIPALSPRPEIRTQWTGVFGVGLITHGLPPILFFSTIYFFYEKKSTGKRIVVFLIALFTFLVNLLVLHRFDIVYWLIVLLTFLYYATNKLNFKNILLWGSFLITILYGISTFRASKFISNVIYYTSEMKYSVKYALFTEPYMYFAMNIENFVHAVERYSNYTYGFFTFNPILSLIQLKHPLEEYMVINKFPNLITYSYNTYTMFFEWYRDFGIFGLTLLPFIWGAIIASSYYHLKKKPNLSTITLYGAFLFVIIFSFFVNMLGWLHFVSNLIALYVIAKVISVNTPQTVPES